jgi:putative peptidoglycan lipid II flippase
VPSAVAFLAIGDGISGVLLEHGQFNRVDSLRVWAILGGSAVGLVASALARLYSSTFYALRDTRTPLRFAIVRVLLTGGLGYLFAFPLPRALGLPLWTGVAGLTASAGIAGWIEFYLLRRAITNRIGPTGMSTSRLSMLWGSALVAGLAAFGVQRALPAENHPALAGIAAILTFTVIYAAATLAFKVPEAQAIMARLRAVLTRLRRR